MTISYQYATEEQIVEHFKTLSRQAIHSVIKHYKTSQYNPLVLEKILRARVTAKAERKAEMCLLNNQ